MTTSTDPGTARSALTPGGRPEFATACAEARTGFQDVVNLAVVADGLRLRDEPDPRTTLNRLIAFGSVSTWERFVRDVHAMRPVPERSLPAERLGCLRTPAGPAVRVLSDASGGELPGAWRVWFPLAGTGTALTFESRPLSGCDEGLAAAVDWWVNTRHGLTHRRLPRDNAWPMTTDGYDSDGRDVGPTTARFALTLFLQLVDQSIRVLAGAAGMARERDLWLPEHWLDGRATPDTDGPRLWTGGSVATPPEPRSDPPVTPRPAPRSGSRQRERTTLSVRASEDLITADAVPRGPGGRTDRSEPVAARDRSASRNR